MKKILVVAAHPDDEVLGCGGTIARRCRAGDEVHVMILAEGLASRLAGKNEAFKEELEELRVAAKRANRILGVESIEFRDFPDNRMDSVDLLDVIRTIEERVQAVRPEIVFTHHSGDVNIDHRRVHEAVVTACRPLPGHPVKALFSFEVASSTEWQVPGARAAFQPNWFEEITGTLEVKLEALKAYQSEMRPWPHSRSIEAVSHLAGWRGATVGVQAAEAFMMERMLNQ